MQYAATSTLSFYPKGCVLSVERHIFFVILKTKLTCRCEVYHFIKCVN